MLGSQTIDAATGLRMSDFLPNAHLWCRRALAASISTIAAFAAIPVSAWHGDEDHQRLPMAAELRRAIREGWEKEIGRRCTGAGNGSRRAMAFFLFPTALCSSVDALRRGPACCVSYAARVRETL